MKQQEINTNTFTHYTQSESGERGGGKQPPKQKNPVLKYRSASVKPKIVLLLIRTTE